MFDQLKNLKGLASLLGGSEEIRQRFEQIQSELDRMRVTGEAGAGAVRVTVNGKYRVMRVELDPVMLGSLAGGADDAQMDREMIEQLVAGATNAAQDKAKDQIGQYMQRLTGGLNLDLPGLDQLLR
jgi:DNA-binding YbaB/EbfC family protein